MNWPIVLVFWIGTLLTEAPVFAGNPQGNWLSTSRLSHGSMMGLLVSPENLSRWSWPSDGIERTADPIVLVSRDSYCRGANPVLNVTGTNVTWYADSEIKVKLAQGNTYQSPSLDQTTTFYLTQTVVGVETPPVAITIEIVEAFLRNIVTTPASCGKNDGMISATATGGTTRNPLFYSLNKGPAQRYGVFTNLAPGTYLLMDSVAAGCWGTIDVIVKAPPMPTLTVDPVDPHCGLADGTLTLSAVGGAGSFRYSLNGVDFSPESQFTNLSGGEYRAWVRDQSGCSVEKTVSLKKSVPLLLNTIALQATRCGLANGRIDLTRASGNGLLTYSVDNLTLTSGVFDNLPAAMYTVTVRDEASCQTSQQVSVGNSEGPTIDDIRVIPATCGQLDGQLTISTSSRYNLIYSLNGMAYQPDSTFTQLPVGHYDVAIKDGQNCIVNQTVQVGEPCQDTVYVPDSFTPNGDGINEGWVIFFTFSSLSLDSLSVFNRWGELIYFRGPFVLKSGDILWNGIDQGIIVTGVYTYQLNVLLPSNKPYVYRGKILVVR